MSDGYLRTLSVQTYAYFWTIIISQLVYIIAFAGYWNLGGFLFSCVYAGILFIPFWLVDTLFLRPAIYPRSTSPSLFIGELIAILAINFAFHATRRPAAGGHSLVQIAWDTSTESFWLCAVYILHTLLSYLLSKLEAKSSAWR